MRVSIRQLQHIIREEMNRSDHLREIRVGDEILVDDDEFDFEDEDPYYEEHGHYEHPDEIRGYNEAASMIRSYLFARFDQIRHQHKLDPCAAIRMLWNSGIAEELFVWLAEKGFVGYDGEYILEDSIVEWLEINE